MIDFDGTVTEHDLLDTIARDFGDPVVYQEVEDGLDAGTMPLREVITREFAPVTAPLEEVVVWVLDDAESAPASPTSCGGHSPPAGTSTSSRAAFTS